MWTTLSFHFQGKGDAATRQCQYKCLMFRILWMTGIFMFIVFCCLTTSPSMFRFNSSPCSLLQRLCFCVWLDRHFDFSILGIPKTTVQNFVAWMIWRYVPPVRKLFRNTNSYKIWNILKPQKLLMFQYHHFKTPLFTSYFWWYVVHYFPMIAG